MSWQDVPGSLDGIALHHQRRAGSVPILMVHGIGPGTTGRVNFEPLIERLAPRFGLHLLDLVGFGASGLKTREPYFDVPFWVRQICLAIDHIVALHGRPPLLVGNSVGGALALKVAVARRDLRSVLVIGAPARVEVSPSLRAFWKAPQTRAELVAAMRPMTASQAEPLPQTVSARLAQFSKDGYADYYNAMLADPQACIALSLLTPEEAARIDARVTLMHGRQDRACPAGAALSTLLPMLPAADLILLGGCGHNIISECSADVLATIERLEKGEVE